MPTETNGRNPRPLDRAAARGVDRVLISERRLRRRVRELGTQLSADYADNELVCVGVLNGVVCFLADLIREMDLMTPIELVDVHRSTDEGTHRVQLPDEPFREQLKGRHVLIIEDIVDTGLTLSEIVAAVRKQGPATVKVCALLDKPAHRQITVPLDYVGFEIPPDFVVGYGLDYEGRYRNLPFVGIVEDAQWLPAMLAQAPST
jgi:hypoxanthine phosphoribosyltransferase